MALLVLAEPKQGHRRPPGMSDVYAVDGPVVLDQRLHGGLPEDALGARRLDPQEVRVFQLDQEAGPLAEVAPQRVPDYLNVAAAPGSQRVRLGFKLEDEAVLVVDRLLADADRVREQVRRGPWVETLLIIQVFS